jgi:hypothetical protein
VVASGRSQRASPSTSAHPTAFHERAPSGWAHALD